MITSGLLRGDSADIPERSSRYHFLVEFYDLKALPLTEDQRSITDQMQITAINNVLCDSSFIVTYRNQEV